MNIYTSSISPHSQVHKNHAHKHQLRVEADPDFLYGLEAAASSEDGHMLVQGTPHQLWEPRGELGPCQNELKLPARFFLLWQSSVSFGPLTEI